MGSDLRSLDPSIRELGDLVNDFRNASVHTCNGLLGRLVFLLDQEPLAGFLRTVLPDADFKSGDAQEPGGRLNWPSPTPRRVALQISLCRAIAQGDPKFLQFLMAHFRSGKNVSDWIASFIRELLAPLVRDIGRLTEQRAIPPILLEAMGTLPKTGDSVLDTLLKDAEAKFRDPSPKSRLQATQLLWDAWERLKTLEDAEDKRASAGRLLDLAARDAPFRAALETEAKEMTRIGNEFHIRHFEANRAPIERPEQMDYLFHRLFALVHLLTVSRRHSASSARKDQ